MMGVTSLAVFTVLVLSGMVGKLPWSTKYSELYVKLKRTEVAVRGYKYCPCPSIQLETRSLEG